MLVISSIFTFKTAKFAYNVFNVLNINKDRPIDGLLSEIVLIVIYVDLKICLRLNVSYGRAYLKATLQFPTQDYQQIF